MKNLANKIQALKASKKGQTLVEYALILAFIAVVSIVVLQVMGNNVKSKFSQVTSGIQQ